MAGDESSEYMADAQNIGVYALNSIANYDRDIIEHLRAPVGAYFAREEPGEAFVRLVDPSRNPLDPEIHPDYPVVEGDYELTADWMLTLPLPCNRRIEDGSMVLWRPGFTIHIVAWDNTPGDSIEDRLQQLQESMSADATNIKQGTDDGVSWVTYDLREDDQDTISYFAVEEKSQLLASFYFDDKEGRTMAEAVALSIRTTE